jgi:hypothetical protein
MSLPLQHTKGRETARDMLELRPRGAGLTARQPELLLTRPHHFLNLGAGAIPATDLCSRQGEAIRGVVLGAVADDQDLQTTRQPAALCPIRVAPQGPQRLTIEAAMLLQATDKIPAIGPNPFQARLRRIPRVEEDGRGATAQVIAGIAEELQGQHVLRRAPAAPKSQAQGEPKLPISPHEQSQRAAIHGPTLPAENPQARPSLAVATGFGITVPSMLRSPRCQTNSVRTAHSRSVGPDHSACSNLVQRSWDTVCSASAKATQLADVR